MKNRKQNIIYQLITSDEPLTASEIAKRLVVSTRTIKMDMGGVREDLKKVGATLVAKRNKGYSIRIENYALFQRYIEQIQLKESTFVNKIAISDTERFLYIARKLIASTTYVKIDDIADELFISRSTLREVFKKVIEFFNSYNLYSDSRAGRGIHIDGAEYLIRMVMTDLLVFHYHKVQLDNACPEFMQWLECEDAERQNIRHSFLQTLRRNEFAIFDNDTQRLSRYLIIARNRYGAGHPIELPEEWVEEIKQMEDYRVAKEVFENLAMDFTGYDLPEHEIAFLAIWMLCYRDMAEVEVNDKRFPAYCSDAKRYAVEILEDVQKAHDIDLSGSEYAGELVNTLIPILARNRFGFIGSNNIIPTINQANQSPVPLEIARTMIGSLESKLGKKVNDKTIVYQFSTYVFKILYFVPYDIKKLNLLVINEDEGKKFGDIAADRLQMFFAPLIGSCTKAEFFEVRGMNQDDYDAILMDVPADIVYNYDLPYATLHTVLERGELERLYNEILVRAYRFEHLLPSDSIVQIYEDFDFVSEEQFFQLLSIKHCRDQESRQIMMEIFHLKEEIVSYRCGEAVFLFGRPELADGESIDVYVLKKPGRWAGGEIRIILYICIDWKNDLKKVKAMKNSLCRLYLEPEFAGFFVEDKSTAFKKLVYESLKI